MSLTPSKQEHKDRAELSLKFKVFKCEERTAEKSRGTSPLTKSFNASLQELHQNPNTTARRKLQNSKAARKQAEEDKKKLMNRIQLLKLEEQRVQCCITIGGQKVCGR